MMVVIASGSTIGLGARRFFMLQCNASFVQKQVSRTLEKKITFGALSFLGAPYKITKIPPSVT
jgi:hypothetical protein